MKPSSLWLVLTLIAGCTDRTVEDWMLGVFSDREPGLSFDGRAVRFRVMAGGSLDYESINSDGVRFAISRTWEYDGADAILMLPGEDEDELVKAHDSWSITRAGSCGPYEFEQLYDGEPRVELGELFRGELCSRPRTDECTGECDCCELYWCEPPPPCSDGG